MATREQIINENRQYCFEHNLYNDKAAPKLSDADKAFLGINQEQFERNYYPKLGEILESVLANPSSTEFPGIPSNVVNAARAFMGKSGFGQGRARDASEQSANDGANQGTKDKAGAGQGTKGTKDQGNTKSEKPQEYKPGSSKITDPVYSESFKRIATVVNLINKGHTIKTHSKLTNENLANLEKLEAAKWARDIFGHKSPQYKAKKDGLAQKLVYSVEDRSMKMDFIIALEKIAEAHKMQSGTELTPMQALRELHIARIQLDLATGHCNFISGSNQTKCSAEAKSEQSTVSQFIVAADKYCGTRVECAGDLEYISIN